MQQIDITDAKTRLPELLEAAINGAEIVITQDDRPLVQLSRIAGRTAVSDIRAQAKASLFLSDHLPDRISAGSPVLDKSAQVWRVPVTLAYPSLGVLGKVGEIVVSAAKEEILSNTSIEEMCKAAAELINKHRDAIEAPLS
jgi:antitoxin (DNA-binding transcriptional repressor) of toxin-antitoxin stability system